MTSCSIVANLVSSDPMKSDLIQILKYTKCIKILGNVHRFKAFQSCRVIQQDMILTHFDQAARHSASLGQVVEWMDDHRSVNKT